MPNDRTIELPDPANENATINVPVADVKTSQSHKDAEEAKLDERTIAFYNMTLTEIDTWIGDRLNTQDTATLLQVICRLIVILRESKIP